ncbi:uncharacterized protein V1510DRAFT_121369 [Dipodascopsis tothii]|uniref:uncharacterized protein n=1 Tax=Dipodascopsis tothii TaxID=44089 RepID=UPI0034CE4009
MFPPPSNPQGEILLLHRSALPPELHTATESRGLGPSSLFGDAEYQPVLLAQIFFSHRACVITDVPPPAHDMEDYMVLATSPIPELPQQLVLLPHPAVPSGQLLYVRLRDSVRVTTWKHFRQPFSPELRASLYLDSYFRLVREWFKSNAPEEDRLGRLMGNLDLSDEGGNELAVALERRHILASSSPDIDDCVCGIEAISMDDGVLAKA